MDWPAFAALAALPKEAGRQRRNHSFISVSCLLAIIAVQRSN